MCGDEKSIALMPMDLLSEILCRFPSKDLLTFKVVCKDWLRLITNRAFIEKHLERSKASCDEPKILVTSLYIAEAQIEIIDYANSFTAKPHLPRAHLLGSCDGLVLYLDILDLSRQSVNRLSRRSRTRYLVFDVYSLYHGDALTPCRTSEEIDDSSFFFFEKVGTLLRGRLHCLAMLSSFGETTIVRYDFETTEVERMWCPQLKYGMLGVVDGCLCSIDRGETELGLGFELWVMREYGVKESWMKLANIEGFDYSYKLTPFAFWPNGDVVLYDKKRLELVKYSFGEKEIKFVKKYKSLMGGVGVACVGSLVSPASIWG